MSSARLSFALEIRVAVDELEVEAERRDAPAERAAAVQDEGIAAHEDAGVPPRGGLPGVVGDAVAAGGGAGLVDGDAVVAGLVVDGRQRAQPLFPAGRDLVGRAARG